MITIKQVDAPEEVAGVRDLLHEYTAWAFTLPGADAQAPTFEGLEEELAALPGPYAPPKGRLLLATTDGQPTGCAALKPHRATVGELKRLLVRPDFRGLRIGRRLASALIDDARGMRLHGLVLDSHKAMTSAHRIYEAAGFRRVGTLPPATFPSD